MSNEREEQQQASDDEVVVDLRKLTMTARGRGLEHVRPLLMVLFLALVVSLAMLLAIVNVAAGQSPAVTTVVEKAISHL